MTPSKQPASNRLSIKPGAEIAKLLDNFGDDGFVELLSGESLAIKVIEMLSYRWLKGADGDIFVALS